jgi:hypothetical protein
MLTNGLSYRMNAAMIGSITLPVAVLLSVPAQAQGGPGDSR